MSCQSNSNKSSGYLPNSIGNINSLQVIIENELWQGAVGDTVRNYLTEFVEGLPQVEPLFSITQLPPSTYTGFARNYRSVLHLTLGDSSFVQFKKNRYAKPQFSVILSAKSNSELIDLFKEQAQNGSKKIKVTHAFATDYHFAVDGKAKISGMPLQYFWFAKIVTMKMIERGFDLTNPYVPELKF